MCALDITKEKLFVSKYHDFHKGRITRRSIPFCRPRVSDAFILILDGSCKYRMDDGICFEAKEGGILYLAKNAVYEMDVNSEKYDFFVINFDFLSDSKRQSAFYPLPSFVAAEQLFSRLYYGGDDKSLSGFAKNMSSLYRIYTLVAESADQVYLDAKTRSKIEKCAEYIKLQFASPELSVSSLAASIGFSEVYFRKLFAFRFGCSPSKFITETRVANAIKLMASEGLSLEEIAEESGFSSPNYLNKVFKSVVGETPAAYRRSLRMHSDIT